MPSNLKPKADEGNGSGNAEENGGKAEPEETKGSRKLRGRPKPERVGRRKEEATVRRNLER